MRWLARAFRGWASVGLLAGLLVACDAQKIVDLEVGVTTEAEVRARWGEPALIYAEADGSRLLEYPRQPAGRVNYVAVIGADGRLRALRQVLKPENFARIAPGWTREQVRHLLGQPAKKQDWPLKRTETWDWRYADGSTGRIFTVTFDADGRVLQTGSVPDEVESGQRG